MSNIGFAERLARVRQRFITSLESKIADSYEALPTLIGEGAPVKDAVAEVYRRIHGISGIGPTVGFAETGRAARNAEVALLTAYRERRGLNEKELDAFRKALHGLRDAAQRELQATFVGWR
ncbi:MAG: hypothetical protein ACLPKB_11920 [Xanthobacteraceae bacterium]